MSRPFVLGCPVGLHEHACVLGSRERLELPGWKETPEARSLQVPVALADEILTPSHTSSSEATVMVAFVGTAGSSTASAIP